MGLESQQYRPSIDGLRAVAVICVVAYHAFPKLVPGGFIGVDIFFVISGYLISGIIFKNLASGTFSFADFYCGRLRRILPALLVVLSATWLLGWFVLSAVDYANLGTNLAAASVFMSNVLLKHEDGYFTTAAEFNPLLHLWSLAVEEQFYLVWPATLYLIWKARLRPMLVLAPLVLLSFSINVATVRSYPIWTFYSLEPRLWELTIGAVLAWSNVHASIGDNVRGTLAWSGIAAIVVSVVTMDASSSYPGWRALFPTVGTALLIAAGEQPWVNRRLLSYRPMIMIGLMSYPLYLWHWPLLSFARIFSLKEPTPSLKIAVIVSAFVLAWLTYRFIERPIRFGRFRELKWRRVVPIGLAALLCSAGATGLATRWAEGLAIRFPDVVRYLASYTYDPAAGYRGGTCLLAMDQSSFGDCVDGDAANGGKPLVVLWGDSHAAHLYPGLKQIQAGAGFSLGQYTADACPPAPGLEGSNRKRCPDINNLALEQIKKLRPHFLIVAGSWWSYPIEQYGRLRTALADLKQSGVRKILLVGPVPVWNPSLPKLLLNFYETSRPRHLPDRMKGAHLLVEIDDVLRQEAVTSNVEFFSAIHALCNADGCLTKIGNGPDELVTWDSAHLTTAGSRLLAEKIYSSFLEGSIRASSSAKLEFGR